MTNTVLKAKRRKKLEELPFRHTFHFRLPLANGKMREFPVPAKVFRGDTTVSITLTAAHVRRALELDGVANTQCCAGAVCALDHAELFNHLIEGYVDWQYSRAYLVSKVDDRYMPSECVVYQHTDDAAVDFDTVAGLKKLLKDLEENGDRTIILRPVTKKPHGTRAAGKTGVRDGSRTKKAVRGHRLRWARAGLGGVPVQAA